MKLMGKVFLGSWIALSLIMAVVVLNVFGTLWFSLQPNPPRNFTLDAVETCANSAIEIYQQGGGRSLANYLAKRANACPAAVLVDTTQSLTDDIFHHRLPLRELTLVQEVSKNRKVTIALLPWHTLIAVPNADGKPGAYVYIGTVWALNHSLPLRMLPQLLTLALISAAFCYVLTLYFGRPLVRLGHLAEELGAGDLSARIDDSLVRRSDELGDLARSLNRMAERIDILVRDYKHFLAHVSHELGSPLTRVNITLALAKRKASPILKTELERIGSETARLNTLVQELLLLARLESGNELGRQTAVFAIAPLIEEVCADAKLEAAEMGKGVVIGHSEDFWIDGHRDLLRRALDNILRNGLRFARDGGSVSVDFFARSDRRLGVICLNDDGPGIEAGQETVIFEPFVSLPNRGQETGQGSGLGLAIARLAVQASRGQISAHNSAKGGLEVTIELPMASGR